jgi:uncharacterized protein YcfJ
MKNSAKLVVAVIALSLGACASSGPRQVVPQYFVDAVVIKTDKAANICYVTNKKGSKKGSALAGGLIGGVAGGLLGNLVGGGSGKTIATVVGTGLGAAAGASMAVSSDYKPREGEKLKCESNGYDAVLTYRHPESSLAITETRRFSSRPKTKSRVNIPVYGEPVWVQ